MYNHNIFLHLVCKYEISVVTVTLQHKLYDTRYLAPVGYTCIVYVVPCKISFLFTHVHTHTYMHTLLSGHAITTDAVDNGQRVGVLALPANPRLLTPRAMQVVGPAAFGCPGDVQYQPPRTLQQIRKTVPSDQ